MEAEYREQGAALQALVAANDCRGIKEFFAEHTYDVGFYAQLHVDFSAIAANNQHEVFYPSFQRAEKKGAPVFVNVTSVRGDAGHLLCPHLFTVHRKQVYQLYEQMEKMCPDYYEDFAALIDKAVPRPAARRCVAC